MFVSFLVRGAGALRQLEEDLVLPVLTVSSGLFVAVVCWLISWHLRRRRLEAEINSLRLEVPSALEAFRQEQTGYGEALAPLKAASRTVWEPFARIAAEASPAEARIYERRLAELQAQWMPFGISGRKKLLQSWRVLLDKVETSRGFPNLVRARIETLTKVGG